MIQFLLLLLATLLPTIRAQCFLDSFDRNHRNDDFESASNPFIGIHASQTLCRNLVDRDDNHRFWLQSGANLTVTVRWTDTSATINMDLYDDSGSFGRLLDSDTVGTRVSALSFRNVRSDVASVVLRVRLSSNTISPSTVTYEMSVVCDRCLSGVWRSFTDESKLPTELRYPVLALPNNALEYRVQWGGPARRRQATALCNRDTLRCPDDFTRVSDADCDFAPCSSTVNTYGCVRDWQTWLTILSESSSSVTVNTWKQNAMTRQLCGSSWLALLSNTDPVSNFQTLSRQYIAARLNMMIGTDASTIYSLLVQSSLILRQHCPLANNVHMFWSQSDVDLARLLASGLIDYNHRRTLNVGPPVCSSASVVFGGEGNLNSLRDLPLPTPAPVPTVPGSTPIPGPLSAVPINQLGDPFVVALGSRWYMTLTAPSGNSWRQSNFVPDSTWSEHSSPFTYGESGLFGLGYVFSTPPGDQYYRQVFMFTDQQLAQTTSATLRVASDDHADIWINNVNVLDDHGDHEYKYWNQVVTVNRSVLQSGINVISAINVNSQPSSDTVFEAELQILYSASLVSLPSPSPTPFVFTPVPPVVPMRTPPTTPRPPMPPTAPPPATVPVTPMPTVAPTACFLDSQSALGFVPQAVNGLPLNQSFVIGTLVHYNCPIIGNAVTNLELTIPIRFTSGLFDGSARFNLELHETNNGGSCPYPSMTACSDRLQWASLTTPDSFVVSNRRFALELLGFSRNSDPTRFDLLSQFYSEERQSNVAYLIATLREAPLCALGFDVCNVCGGDGTSCAPFGCDGVRGSGAKYDRCGVCNGDNRCIDCAGVVFGTRVLDRCNVCGGDDMSCLDCRAVRFGTMRYDRCDVCGGNGVSCLDCAGTPFGTKTIDKCGRCGGDGNGCMVSYDCFGVLNGTARHDACGVCNGNGLSCRDCRGVVNGTAVLDWCSVCDGDGSSCVDCSGVRHGTKVLDKCGVCGGNDNSCRGCDGVPLSGFVYDPCGVCQKQLPSGGFASLSCVSGCDRMPFAPYKVFDRCGVCGGTNACLDCRSTPHGTARYDRCDVCGGDGTLCVDCAGVPFGDAKYNVCGECELSDSNRRRQATERPLLSCITGCDLMPWSTKVYDVCGVCGGNGLSCLDCKGVPHGTSRYDVCGVCGGDNRSCRDCKGIVNGSARYDPCGVCNGDSSTCRDCLGVVNGHNKYDKCGVCGGADRCLDCAGTPFGDAVYNVCDVCVGAARKRVVECLDCAGVPFGTRTYDRCDVCGGNGSSCPRTEAPSATLSSTTTMTTSTTVTPRTEAPEATTTSVTQERSSTPSSSSTTTSSSSFVSESSTTTTTSSARMSATQHLGIRGGQPGDGIDVDTKDAATGSSNAATIGAVIGTLLGLSLLGGGVLTALWLRRRSLRAPKTVDNNPVFEEAIGDAEL